nr:MAG TPA: hypothetical protein [Caudoviricetes sp.]
MKCCYGKILKRNEGQKGKTSLKRYLLGRNFLSLMKQIARLS